MVVIYVVSVLSRKGLICEILLESGQWLVSGHVPKKLNVKGIFEKHTI